MVSIQTVTVVVPVHNAEATLSRQVSELLEVLSDWQSRFEILIVDDASTDQTLEYAQDLAREYPQLRVLRHRRRQGRTASIRAGMRQSQGEVVFVHDDQSPLRAMPRPKSIPRPLAIARSLT